MTVLVPISLTPVRTEADRIPWRKPALQESRTER